jgi:hypothetical protein
MSTPDNVELLISRLSGPLDPSDRPLFRHAAESALAAPACWGDGLAYRVVAEVWKPFFHPPPDDRHVPKRHQRSSKLINEPPIARASRSDEL